MDKFAELTDEELFEKLRAGEEEIMEYLLEKYKYLVRKRAKDMYLIGGEGEDLIQEGMIGLFKAVRDYQSDKEASFAAFADLCISRQIYSAIQASNRMKHMPLNTYISLYAKEDDARTGSSERPLIEQLEGLHTENPETMVIAQETMNEMREKLHRMLSRMELEVFLLYLAGNDYAKIATIVDKSPKAVDNALQRARAKLSHEERH